MFQIAIAFLHFFVLVQSQRRLVASIAFGGNGTDLPNDSILSPSKDMIAIVGDTTSKFFLQVSPVLTNQVRSGQNGFLSILSYPDLNVSFSSMFGGTGVDDLECVTWGSNNRIYFAGSSNSNNLLTKVNGTALHSGRLDPYAKDIIIGVIYFDGSAYFLETFGFFGGSDVDSASKLASDIYNNNVYLVGTTASPNFPVFNEFYNRIYEGTGITYESWFVTIFNADLREIIFSTYLGGDAPGTHSSPVIELYYSIASSPATTLYFGGSTTVSNISLVDPIRNYNSSFGVNNFYLAVINITDQMNVTLLQSTYYGEGDSIADMEIDYSRHELILCGQSADSSLGTVNTDNNAPAGSADVVILGFGISGNFSAQPNLGFFFGSNVGVDTCEGMRLDSAGYIHVTGLINNFTETEVIFLGGTYTNFIAAFDPSGNLNYSSKFANVYNALPKIFSGIFLDGSKIILVGNSKVNKTSDVNVSIVEYFPPITSGLITTIDITSSPLTTGSVTTSPATTGLITTSPVLVSTSLENATNIISGDESSSSPSENVSAFWKLPQASIISYASGAVVIFILFSIFLYVVIRFRPRKKVSDDIEFTNYKPKPSKPKMPETPLLSQKFHF